MLVLRGANDDQVTVPIAAGEKTTGVGVAHDGSLIVGYASGLVERLSGAEYSQRLEIGHHPAPVFHGPLSPDGALAASTDSKSNTTVWDLATGQAVWTSTLSARERWEPDIEPVFNDALEDGTPVFLGVVRGGPPPVDTEPLQVAHIQLAFSADSRVLYMSGTGTSGLEARDAESGSLAWSVANTPTGGDFPQFELRADGAIVAGRLVIENGVVVQELAPGSKTDNVALSPDQTLHAAAAGSGIELWSTNGDQVIARAIERGGHDAASISSDGQLVASFVTPGPGADPGPGTVWDVGTRTPRATDADGGTVLSFMRDRDFMSYYYFDDAGFPGRTIVVRDPETFEPLGPPLPPRAGDPSRSALIAACSRWATSSAPRSACTTCQLQS